MIRKGLDDAVSEFSRQHCDMTSSDFGERRNDDDEVLRGYMNRPIVEPFTEVVDGGDEHGLARVVIPFGPLFVPHLRSPGVALRCCRSCCSHAISHSKPLTTINTVSEMVPQSYRDRTQSSSSRARWISAL